MYAPEGYCFFQEILDRINSLVASAYPFNRGRHALEVVESRSAARNHAIVEFAETCPSFSVASPDGRIMRISPRIAGSRIVDLETSVYEFAFIDQCGLIDIQRVQIRAAWATKTVTPMLAEIDADAERQFELEPDVTELYRSIDDLEYLRAIRPFDGWSVVCRVEDLPKDARALAILNDALATDLSPEATAREIVAALIDLVDAGKTPSREEFRQRECAHMKRDEFRAVWAEAARSRPVLSRSGPKKTRA